MNFTEKRYIMTVLEKQKEYTKKVLSLENESILGIFALGSMNYGLYTSESDVDSILITIPSIERLCIESRPISKELKYNDKEKIKVRDIRSYAKILLKQNETDLQSLFTQFYIINSKYKNYFENYFIKPREEIARINPSRAVASLKAQSLHLLEKAEKDIYNDEIVNKIIAKVKRYYYLLKKYCEGESYEECLNISNVELKNYLLSLKNRTLILSTEEKYEIIDGLQCKIFNLDLKNDKDSVTNLETLLSGIIKLVKARNNIA